MHKFAIAEHRQNVHAKLPVFVQRVTIVIIVINFKKNPVWDAGAWLVFHWLTSAGPPFFVIRIDERRAALISTENSYPRGICLASNVFALEQEVP